MYLFVLLCILKQNINRVFILGSILGSSYVKSKEVGRKGRLTGQKVSEYGLVQLHCKPVMVSMFIIDKDF